MGCKAETTCNINNTFIPGIASKCTVRWWFRKFAKGDENFEDEECSSSPWKVDNDQLKSPSKLILLTVTQEFAEEHNIDHSIVVQHLKQIGKVKKLDRWVPHELTEKKNLHFEVSSSLILRNNKPFLNRIVTRDKMWIL